VGSGCVVVVGFGRVSVGSRSGCVEGCGRSASRYCVNGSVGIVVVVVVEVSC
jgi:hypothetical protein